MVTDTRHCSSSTYISRPGLLQVTFYSMRPVASNCSSVAPAVRECMRGVVAVPAMVGTLFTDSPRLKCAPESIGYRVTALPRP